MKSFVIAILIIAVGSGLLACGGRSADKPMEADEREGLNVVATFLPLQVFTANVTANHEGVSVDILLPPEGVDPHNFSMSPKDVTKLYEADVVIINGFGFEGWLGKVLGEVEESAIVVTASEGIEPIYYEDRHLEGTSGWHHGDINPHCWVSPKRAIKMVGNIRDGLIKADPEGEEVYARNAGVYIGRLTALDSEIISTLEGVAKREIVTFHDAFAYFAEDYEIDILAVIETHAGQQPSAREMVKLVEIIKENQVAAIFAEPFYPTDVADVLADETGVEVLILDPYGTGKFSLDGYEKVWWSNMQSLVRALK